MTPSKTSVLIVEDDQMLRSAYETVLTMDGYETSVAADGQEALALAKKIKPNVILLDMLMPTMNGLEFLEQFRAKTEHPTIKIIVFSNMSVPSDVQNALRHGACKYLTKSSFTPREIEDIIKEVLAEEE
ncbi:MAG TPA: response regulator [Candidatus Saccharimonadia bacterium]